MSSSATFRFAISQALDSNHVANESALTAIAMRRLGVRVGLIFCRVSASSTSSTRMCRNSASPAGVGIFPSRTSNGVPIASSKALSRCEIAPRVTFRAVAASPKWRFSINLSSVLDDQAYFPGKPWLLNGMNNPIVFRRKPVSK